jgi:hypothetical protein
MSNLGPIAPQIVSKSAHIMAKSSILPEWLIRLHYTEHDALSQLCSSNIDTMDTTSHSASNKKSNLPYIGRSTRPGTSHHCVEVNSTTFTYDTSWLGLRLLCRWWLPFP